MIPVERVLCYAIPPQEPRGKYCEIRALYLARRSECLPELVELPVFNAQAHFSG